MNQTVTVEALKPIEGDLRDIVAAVTEAFLHIHASASSQPGKVEWSHGDQIWTGCVTVRGAFNGAVTLTCTRRLARQAARAMFDSDVDVSEDLARDALAELTNVVGGNIKSLFSAMVDSTCQMSLPLVAVGGLEIAGEVLQELWSECGDERIAITIYELPAAQ